MLSMKLIGGSRVEENDFIDGRNQRVSLDELFELASAYGELRTGGTFGPSAAEIYLKSTGEDFVIVKSRKYQTLKENIQECLQKSRIVMQLYRGESC